MAGTPTDKETTTTTTVDDTTTTTTGDVPQSDTSNHAQPTGGETVVDQDAKAEVLGGDVDVAKTDTENAAANIEAGKQAALENHAADHANDHEDGRSKPSAV